MSKRTRFDAEAAGQLAGGLGLAHARGAGEQVAAYRLLRLPQAGARELHRAGQRLDGRILSEHHGLQIPLQRLQGLPVVAANALRGYTRDLRDDVLDIPDADRLLPPARGQQQLGGAHLIDHVYRLVGKLAVVDVPRRQRDGRSDRFRGVPDPVVLLVVGLEAHHDLDGVGQGGFVDVDLLEAADQRPILLEVVAVLLVGRGAYAAQGSAGQGGLQQVRGVHRSAAGRTRADDRMDLVDEQDRPLRRLEFGQHLLEPFLEVAAIARAGEERSHVQGEDARLSKDLRHVPADDVACQALGDRRLAHARIPDIERVVLRAAAEDLDGALDLVLAADQGIDLAGLRLGVQVDAVGCQGARVLRRRLVASAVPSLPLLPLRTAHPLRLRHARRLGDAVADVVDRVEARHLLLLEQVDGVALPFGEERDQYVRAGDLLAPR